MYPYSSFSGCLITASFTWFLGSNTIISLDLNS